MKRLGAILCFAGAVLVSTHILAPAAPPPAPAAITPQDVAAVAQTAPVVEQVDAQVDRLRERLASPPAYPPPVRDPFRFGQRAEPSRPKPASAPAMVIERPVAPAPALPRLIAIATNVTDGTSVRTAILSSGDDVQVVKAGDAYGKLVIRSISVDAIELVDPSEGSIYKISLQ